MANDEKWRTDYGFCRREIRKLYPGYHLRVGSEGYELYRTEEAFIKGVPPVAVSKRRAFGNDLTSMDAYCGLYYHLFKNKLNLPIHKVTYK